jgi:hypothetical protein
LWCLDYLATKAKSTALDHAIPVGARLPAIYRAAVAKSGNSIVTDTPHAQALLPVPGRSRARWNATPVAPTPSAESKAELQADPDPAFAFPAS